jgi:hypothetical protein
VLRRRQRSADSGATATACVLCRKRFHTVTGELPGFARGHQDAGIDQTKSWPTVASVALVMPRTHSSRLAHADDRLRVNPGAGQPLPVLLLWTTASSSPCPVSQAREYLGHVRPRGTSVPQLCNQLRLEAAPRRLDVETPFSESRLWPPQSYCRRWEAIVLDGRSHHASAGRAARRTGRPAVSPKALRAAALVRVRRRRAPEAGY